MSDPTLPPVRMRYSLESCCRVVQAVLDGATPEEAALAYGASRSSGYRWWGRYRAAGWASLRDRPCTPHRQPRRLSREAETEIIAVRERSGGGPEVVGAIVDRPASTVGKVLRRLGRSRLPKPPRPPVVRYERERAGELLHIDTKKLGRFWHVGKRILRDGVQRSPRAGWQHVHVAVDDHTRLSYAEVLLSDRRADALAFLERALRWFAAQRITVEEVIPTTAPPTARAPGECVASSLGCATCVPGPTRRAPTARPSASSKPCCAAGPTAASTPPARTARAPSPAGSGGTTDAVPMARSLAALRSAVSHTSVVSTPRPLSSSVAAASKTAAHGSTTPGASAAARCAAATFLRIARPL